MTAFNPGNYYYVGGNSKFYGAVLIRYRRRRLFGDGALSAASRRPGRSPMKSSSRGTPGPNAFSVRGALGEDPTEPFHSSPYPFGRCPTSRRSPAPAPTQGPRPASGFAAARRRHRCLAQGRQDRPGMRFPTPATGKMDAETRPLAAALADRNIRLETGAHVEYLEASSDEPDDRSRSLSPERRAEESCRRSSSSSRPARSIRRPSCCVRRPRTARASPTAPTRSAATS